MSEGMVVKASLRYQGRAIGAPCAQGKTLFGVVDAGDARYLPIPVVRAARGPLREAVSCRVDWSKMREAMRSSVTNAPAARPLIVLGMHRSGNVSFLTGLLALAGIRVGTEEELTTPNEELKGFFERRDLRAICDALLQAGGAEWWRPADFNPAAVSKEVTRHTDRNLAAADPNIRNVRHLGGQGTAALPGGSPLAPRT